MRRRAITAAILIIGFAGAALLTANGTRAIEVKKDLYQGGGSSSGGSGGPARPNPLTPTLQRKLVETVESESESYLGQESEKKASGETYVDLENAKLKYFPENSGGKVQVTAKLEGAEFKPPKSGTGKPRATGKRRVLVFKYKLDGQNWTEAGQPAWQDVAQKGDKAANQ